MFEIEYKGANAVVIKTKNAVLVTDPRLSIVGLKDIKINNAIELATEARFALNDENSRLLIEGPGDYEVGDFLIHGIAATRHIDSDSSELSTIYSVQIDDIRIAVIGNIAASPSDDQIEELGMIDIVILPVGGGGYTLDGVSASTIVRSINPKLVIPIHYFDEAIKYEVPQDELEIFVKELAAPVDSAGTKLKIKSAASMLAQPLTVVKIDRS